MCPSLTGTRMHCAVIAGAVAFWILPPAIEPQTFSGSRSDFSSSPGMNGMTLSTISGQVSNVLPAPEIAWYVHRLQTGWRTLGVALVVFHFVIPFALLLSRKMKREGHLIVKVAILILLVRLLDLFWLIAPEFHEEGMSVSWLDVALPLSLGAIWTGCFIRQLRGRAILPVHDPEFDEALGRIIERGGERPSAAH